MSAIYAVAGVSGNTGAVAADTLLAQGKSVRVIVRDAAKGESWRTRGAEVAVAALEDVAALTRALAGVAGAYVLIPPRLGSKDPLGENRVVAAAIADAVRAAEVPHVVLLSSVAAHVPSGTGPIQSARAAELALASTGAATTFIRASFFMENWFASLGMLDQGVLPTFLPPSSSLPMVATRDIGRVAAQALVEGGKGAQVIELAGPREYSSIDAAAELTAIVGKPISAHAAPLDAVVPTFTSFGISEAVATLYREMYAAYAAGLLVAEAGNRVVRGSTTLGEVLGAKLGK
jgi:uncharacterized protein YbjT (DUF2867 family)